jgi:rare lipoprotein A
MRRTLVLLVALLTVSATPACAPSRKPAFSTTSGGAVAYHEQGKATYYSDKYQGGTTANGEKYDKNKMTAAHPDLPFGTRVRVTSLDNGRSVIVRINDRFPGQKGRIIDLSKKAFAELAPLEAGVIAVDVQTVDQE